jgi:uncharacterized protein (TIGR03437 family)
VAFGNFNGPPLPGAAITATGSPQPMVKGGVETGGVASLTNYAVPNGAATVATADFNGDGKVDLAVVYTGAFSGTSQSPVYQIANGSVVPLPIDVAAPATQIYLEMYGTGIRNATHVTVTVGNVNVPVLYAGAAPGYAGEDQVNIGPLPQTLAGAGNVNIVLSANGQTANTVNVTIQ